MITATTLMGKWPRVGLACLAVALTAPLAAKETPLPTVRPNAWQAAAASPNYAQATAGEPQFDDQSLWPGFSGKELYAKQHWPKGRLLVWSHPGKTGGVRFGKRALNVTDPKNWLENGGPCERLILDESTDLLLPASDTPYMVGFRETPVAEICRHVTIGAGAGFVGGGDGRGRKIAGNVWIKRGGQSDCQGSTDFVGSGHTFFRNDNVAEIPSPGRRNHASLPGNRDGRLMVAQYFTFQKDQKASVEFLGHVTVLDEFRIFASTVIVGPDSILQPGRNAEPVIDRDGVLALMDGARFESWNNDFDTPEMTVVKGTIQGGLPERPLTRNCNFGLAFKNHTNAQYRGPGAEKQDSRAVNYPRVPSLVVRSGSLRSYSRDLAKARLVFSLMENQDICSHPDSDEYHWAVDRNPDVLKLFGWKHALPKGTDCFLGREVVIDGVEFDYLRKGGLMSEASERGSAWKNMAFGPHCQGKGDEVFSHGVKLTNGNTY